MFHLYKILAYPESLVSYPAYPISIPPGSTIGPPPKRHWRFAGGRMVARRIVRKRKKNVDSGWLYADL